MIHPRLLDRYPGRGLVRQSADAVRQPTPARLRREEVHSGADRLRRGASGAHLVGGIRTSQVAGLGTGEADMVDEADTEATEVGMEATAGATAGGEDLAVEGDMAHLEAATAGTGEGTAVTEEDTVMAVEDDTAPARLFVDRMTEAFDDEVRVTVLEADRRRDRGRGQGRTAVRGLGPGPGGRHTPAASAGARRRGKGDRCRGASAEVGVRSEGGAIRGPSAGAQRSEAGGAKEGGLYPIGDAPRSFRRQ